MTCQASSPHLFVVRYLMGGHFRATRHIEGCPVLERARREFEDQVIEDAELEAELEDRENRKTAVGDARKEFKRSTRR